MANDLDMSPEDYSHWARISNRVMGAYIYAVQSGLYDKVLFDKWARAYLMRRIGITVSAAQHIIDGMPEPFDLEL